MDSAAPDKDPSASATAPPEPQATPPLPSRYESQKRRDWNTFLQYLQNQRPPLALAGCCGGHVVEFLRYLDQFGKTKVHAAGCAFFGRPSPPAPCACPLRQAWGSLDSLIGRLRAAYEESGGGPEANPFAARAVRLYLRDVRESQALARGVRYDKKKRKRTLASDAENSGTGEPSSLSCSVGGLSSAAATAAAERPSASNAPPSAGSSISRSH